MNEELYKKVLNGEHVELGREHYIAPAGIVDFMTTKGYEYDIDTNGWQHDFWIRFTHNDEKLENIILAGCWYYGGQTLGYDND